MTRKQKALEAACRAFATTNDGGDPWDKIHENFPVVLTVPVYKKSIRADIKRAIAAYNRSMAHTR